jgi:murein DD-endopeptidase MepM/ murein hydrolase activator NlpD
MRAAAFLLSWAADLAAALAAPRVSWSPQEPGDGRPVLFAVSGLPSGAQVTATFLKQKLRFTWDEGARAHLALGAVPLGTRPRAHPIRVIALSGGARTEIAERVKTRRVRYPRAVVRIKPQPGAVRPGERAVDGRARIRAALRRRTPERFWSLPFLRPLGTRVTEAFGVRRLYRKMAGSKVVQRWRGRHMGLDLDGKGGEPIAAVADGEVAVAGHFHGTGKSVFIDHGQGFFTAYFHMREIAVEEGARVRRGQVIGRVGATGRVSGPHLHLAVHVNGSRVDPAALLELRAPGN